MVDYTKFDTVADSDEEPIWASPDQKKPKTLSPAALNELEQGAKKIKGRRCYVHLDFATSSEKLQRYREEFEREGAPVPKSKLGRVIIELDQAAHAPRLCENFRLLCTGERGVGARGNNLCYLGRPLDYIMPRYCIQASIPNELSCWGRDLEDEKLRIPGCRFDSAGVVCVGNHGPNTNSTSFMITLHEAEHLNGYNQIIGRVVQGMDVLRVIESLPTDGTEKSYAEKTVKTYFGGQPIVDVVIDACGELRPEQVDAVGAGDGLVPLSYPVQVTSPKQYDALYESAQKIKAAGNQDFREKSFSKAVEKYQKAQAYLEPLMEQDFADSFYDVEPDWAPKTREALLRDVYALDVNVCQVRLGQEEWRAAIGAADQTLEKMRATLSGKDPLVGKLLYKRARARVALADQGEKGNLVQAIEDLQTALSIEPESTEVAAELEKARLRQRCR